MSLLINDPFGKPEDAARWTVTCASRCLTDILIQVYEGEEHEGDKPVLAFCLGELMRQEFEDHSTLDGHLLLDDVEAANLTRWADQLELYSQILRSALKCRRVA